MILATVLKSGPEYSQRQLDLFVGTVRKHNPNLRIVCLTDVDITTHDVERIPLEHGWPGWWSKMELFRPGLLTDDTLYCDLDSVCIGAIPDGIVSDNISMLRCVYKPRDVGSGVMTWRGDKSHIYRAFTERPEHWMATYTTQRLWGDQAFIRDNMRTHLGVIGTWARSYKAQCRRGVPPPGTKLIYFHGQPRPWNVWNYDAGRPA